MPIQLNFTNPATGQNNPLSFWVAKKANIDSSDNFIDYILFGYVDQASKTSGKSEFMRVAGTSTLAQIATAIYNWAIAHDLFFSGGTIV